MIRTKTCPTCGKRFSYEIGKGKDRKHCSSKCRVKHQINCWKGRIKDLPRCRIPDCEKPAVRRKYGLCESCYYRLRRNGTTKKRQPKYRYKTGAGYIKLRCLGHFLSDSDGYIFEHRKVLYDLLGKGLQTCFWCGKNLPWDAVVIDHQNEIKHDNRPDNLRISCNGCNRALGSAIPFVKRIQESAMPIFLNRIHNSRRACHDEKTKREMVLAGSK